MSEDVIVAEAKNDKILDTLFDDVTYSMSEFSLLVQEYYKNPINNFRLEDATIFRHEWNIICGDDITVYLNIQSPSVGSSIWDGLLHTSSESIPEGATLGSHGVITARSYDGNVSMVTQAAASFFSELVVWHTIEEVLTWKESLLIEQWFEVSHRRRRARVIALLATQNAIHAYLQDNVVCEFDDVLDG